MVESKRSYSDLPPADVPPSSRVASSGLKHAHLVHMTGSAIGQSRPLGGVHHLLGRSREVDLRIEEPGISRQHARIIRIDADTYAIEDAGSRNGTFVNGVRITERTVIRDGDKIRLGAAVLKFALLDEIERAYQDAVEQAISRGALSLAEAPTQVFQASQPWTPFSWRNKPIAQNLPYADPVETEQVLARLRRLPPLVTSWEVEELKGLIADAQEGRRFILQGGDCAETVEDCAPEVLTNKLKILIQMSLVLVRGARRPVVRIGRFAGQYAKPRSKLTEIVDGVEMPSYMGDLTNRPGKTLAERRPDPQLLLRGYYHASMTLNFIRAMSRGGFSDLRRKEYFDLSYFEKADLPPSLRVDYQRVAREITDGLDFMRAVGDRAFDDLMKVTFFTSHEGLNLEYEAAQTRRVPRRDGFYDLTTHLPWIGERTRQVDGAHVEFFRGIENPVGLKIGPSADPADILEVVRRLNPWNEPGKIVLITRMGAKNVRAKLPALIQTVTDAGRRVLWVSDPMHGNGMVTATGTKTRNFDDILEELTHTADVHDDCGTFFGGVHFELTGEDVTECIGGGLGPEDLVRNYATLCDPRLNYRQAMQMAFCLAERLKGSARRPSTIPPPPPSRAR